MTDTPAAHPTDPFDAEAPGAVEGLHPVDPAYAKVLRVATALNLIPLAIGASVFDSLLIRHIEGPYRSEEHTSELQSLMRISYAVFCLKKKKSHNHTQYKHKPK